MALGRSLTRRLPVALLPALLIACGDKTDDTGPPSDDTEGFTTDDSGAPTDMPPTLSLTQAFVGGAVGDAVDFEVVITDEDLGTVALDITADDTLLTGAFNGNTFTGAANAPGSGLATITATDSGGQSTSIVVPVETWVPRTWTGLQTVATSSHDFPAPDMGVNPAGWTYHSGYTGESGTLVAIDPSGDARHQVFDDPAEYGRGAAWAPTQGHAIYVGESIAAQRGRIRGVDESGVLWASESPWPSSTTYWVDAEPGLVAQTGPFYDLDGEQGAWASVVDPSDGSQVGEPIILGSHPERRPNVQSVDIMDDGRLLLTSYGSVDTVTGDPFEARASWVQVAQAGDVAPVPLVTYKMSEGGVSMRHAIELRDGNIAVLGETYGELFGPLVGAQTGVIDVLSPDGTSIWSLQSDSEGRFLRAAQGHDGTLYVLGDAGSNGGTVHLLCFDPTDGTETCHSSISIDAGTGHAMAGRGVAFSGQDVLVNGYYVGTLAAHGLSSAGGYDTWVARFDTQGVLQ